MKRRVLIGAAGLALCGCTVVTANRSFPTVAWYWSKDAQAERASRAAEREYHDRLMVNDTNAFSPLPGKTER